MSAVRKGEAVSGQRKTSKSAAGSKLLTVTMGAKTARSSATGQFVKATHIRKHGNSAGINLSAQILAISGLDIDSAVSVEAVAGEIIIKAAKPRVTLESLLANSPEARIKQSNKDAGWFDDEPQGLELI